MMITIDLKLYFPDLNWKGQNEPDNFHNEDCVQLLADREHLWDDRHCSTNTNVRSIVTTIFIL